MWRMEAMTCLLDRETYRRWESYFNDNGLPLPPHYEMRAPPAPLPHHQRAPLPDPPQALPHNKPRQEPVKSKADRLARLWTEEEAEKAARKLQALELFT